MAGKARRIIGYIEIKSSQIHLFLMQNSFLKNVNEKRGGPRGLKNQKENFVIIYFEEKGGGIFFCVRCKKFSKERLADMIAKSVYIVYLLQGVELCCKDAPLRRI